MPFLLQIEHFHELFFLEYKFEYLVGLKIMLNIECDKCQAHTRVKQKLMQNTKYNIKFVWNEGFIGSEMVQYMNRLKKKDVFFFIQGYIQFNRQSQYSIVALLKRGFCKGLAYCVAVEYIYKGKFRSVEHDEDFLRSSELMLCSSKLIGLLRIYTLQ